MIVRALGGAHRLADRSMRLGALDPFLTTARAMGLVRWGATLSALVHASARRWPARPAIIDDHGTVSYRDLDDLVDRLANTLRADGQGTVGLLCRNHRGFPAAQLALERSGRNVVLLNTGLTAAQLSQIITREKLTLVIADAEFADRISQADTAVRVFAADPDALTWGRPGYCPRPTRASNVVILTSGTTGPPKGARRGPQRSAGAATFLDVLPIQMNDVVLVASPLFHAWGLAQATIALSTGSTMVLHRRFDPRVTLGALERDQVTVLAVVPLMLRRLLEHAPASTTLPHLRAVVSSGNVLSATLATAWIDRFGPNLYNIYGSTETALASVASPQDLVNAPGTVGSPPPGVTIAILDDDNEPVAAGSMGRVFTANSMQFDGYTDGTTRTRHGNLMATGDLGYLDSVGRLFVDGRENDLIVTGGENVFPAAVEEVLEKHPDVRQAAVVGKPDDEFGQRVVAYVVADDAAKFDTAQLETWCREQFAAFERPRTIHLVESLPMTTTGKIMRHKLAHLDIPTDRPTEPDQSRSDTS